MANHLNPSQITPGEDPIFGFCFSCRAIDTNSYADDGAGSLSRRSYTLGLMVVVLLVGSGVCLLGLLLRKRERR